jgi:hypothetical protein
MTVKENVKNSDLEESPHDIWRLIYNYVSRSSLWKGTCLSSEADINITCMTKQIYFFWRVFGGMEKCHHKAHSGLLSQ